MHGVRLTVFFMGITTSTGALAAEGTPEAALLIAEWPWLLALGVCGSLLALAIWQRIAAAAAVASALFATLLVHRALSAWSGVPADLLEAATIGASVGAIWLWFDRFGRGRRTATGPAAHLEHDGCEPPPAIARAMQLARRHGRPLTLITLGVRERPGAPRDRRAEAARVAEVLDRAARKTDFLTLRRQGRIDLFCPETGAPPARELAHRLRRTLAAECGLEVGFGIATFPSHAYTFEDLVERAEADLVGAEVRLEAELGAAD